MAQIADWNVRTAVRIGARVARYRKLATVKGRPMSAQALADRCAELGHPIDRTVIVKLEKGGRQSVTVAELLVLAKALGIPPVALVFAPGWDEMSEALPDQEVPSWLAVRWFTGEDPFPTKLTDRPGWAPTSSDQRDWRADRAGLNAYRYHEQHIEGWRSERQRAAAARKAATVPDTPEGEQRAHLQAAENADRAAANLLAPLHGERRFLRQQDMRLPELPPELQHIDDEDYQPDWRWMRA